MDEQRKIAGSLQKEVQAAWVRLGIDTLLQELNELRVAAEAPDFWQDNDHAQQTMKRIARLESRTTPWVDLSKALSEFSELVELGDESLRDELENQSRTLRLSLAALKEDLKFRGPYDSYDAILSIYAGAGGTDAQDWAQMLERMYLRFFEASGFETVLVDESMGDEAGIKSATMAVSGNFVYGKLKGEHGVHRLVRLSPFNADHLRQTSFAKVEVMPKIDQQGDLIIDDKDLKVDVYRSGGHGGQSVNTTDSAVRVTHLPTGISVAIQNERSQLQNKETALTILRSKLASLQLEQHQERLDKLKGPNQSAEWGNQIRSYVLHPYKQVKDLRTRYESSDPDGVLGGQLDGFINAYLDMSIGDT